MILITTVDHLGFQGSQDVYISSSQTEDERPAHGILVEIQPRLTHRGFGPLDNCRSQCADACSS
jgi:hypothetical protein